MKVSDIMTPRPCTCSPDHSLQQVARMMREHDCGAVPVTEDGYLVGIVTVRDLVVRGFASGKSVNAPVCGILTEDPWCCGADDDVRDLEQIMADNQIRRVPIVDRYGNCIGIVSQADLTRAARTLGKSAPGHFRPVTAALLRGTA